jgi:DNA-binding MarR family transcriptional regulator/GNAT superfamily N-acetyltransferase
MSIMTTLPIDADFSRRVETVRAFNRFYTQRIGVLEDDYLDSTFSLAQVRVLYELAHRDAPTASEIGRELGLDTGYLSRILRGFERAGLIKKRAASSDARRRLLSLTARGRELFAPLEAASRQQIAALLSQLPSAEQRRLIEAMESIMTALGNTTVSPAPYLLRPHQPGDMGWVVQRHGALYAEYGYDETFEALVAEIVAGYIRNVDPRRERCWIAERNGENVGSVFLIAHPERERVAKLRLLLVEPSARGLGIGRRLVDECTRFASQAGYHTITLWTQSHLESARRIYQAAGYRLVHEAPHHSFSLDLVEQTWELNLRGCQGVKVMG